MTKNKLLLFLLLSLFVPSTIYADCSKKEIENFKDIEDEYKIIYDFDKTTKLYTLTIYMPQPKLYYFATENDSIFANCEAVNDTTTKCSNVQPNTYDLEIIGITETCNDTLKKMTLTLPKYNSYSEDRLCEGIEEFVLCQPTYDKEIDYDTFVSRVNTYKNNNQNKKEEITENKEEPNEIIEYIKNNLLQIIIIIIFIIMVIITIILTAKSIKKSRRLE